MVCHKSFFFFPFEIHLQTDVKLGFMRFISICEMYVKCSLNEYLLEKIHVSYKCRSKKEIQKKGVMDKWLNQRYKIRK